MSPVAGVIPAPPVPVRIARYRSARFLTLLMVCILTAVAKELVTDVL